MARPKGGTDARERIVDAAWALFYEKGFEHTTVDEIIARSNTSKGSFYYYFKTKDDLLETLSAVLDEFYEEIAGELEDSSHAMDQLLLLNEKAHAMMEQKIARDLIARLYSTQLGVPGSRHQLLDRNRTYYRLISGIVERGQQKGEISTDKTSGEIVQYYAMCERALVTEWCMHQGEFSLAEYSREYMPVMMEHFRK